MLFRSSSLSDTFCTGDVKSSFACSSVAEVSSVDAKVNSLSVQIFMAIKTDSEHGSLKCSSMLLVRCFSRLLVLAAAAYHFFSPGHSLHLTLPFCHGLTKTLKYLEYFHLVKQLELLASAESEIFHFKPLEPALMQQKLTSPVQLHYS